MQLLVQGVKVDDAVATIAKATDGENWLGEQFKVITTSNLRRELAREVVVEFDASRHAAATEFAKDAPDDDAPRGRREFDREVGVGNAH